MQHEKSRSGEAISAAGPPPDPAVPVPFAELIALMALLMSLTAMSIDIMLPALPAIGATLNVTVANDLQMIVSAYMIGLAAGQIVWGPLADRWGRRLPLLAGLALFIAASVTAALSGSFTVLLAARMAQGFGGAAGRIVATAVVRDLFSGRQMARVMSTVMMVFIAVPILAPSVGQGILLVGNWRWTFGILAVAALISMFWFGVRMPETGARAVGTPRLSVGQAFRLVVSTPATRGYGIAAGFMFGTLVAYISTAQQIFVDVYDLGRLFPLVFGGVASAMAIASFTNARLVQRIGMRRLSHMALVAFLAVSTLMAGVSMLTTPPLAVLLVALAACFFLFGLIQPNFNAIAMQPVGQAAGMAASVLGSYTTAAGAIIGSLIARQFDGTPLPLAAGFALLALCAFLTVIAVEGRNGLFRGE